MHLESSIGPVGYPSVETPCSACICSRPLACCDPRAEMVGAEGLGHEAHQTQRAAEGQGCRRAQARSHPSPHVDRRDRVQLVKQGGCCLTSITRSQVLANYRKRRPCRDGGGGEIG